MKPNALKSPFSFAERRPLLSDGVFYVPEYYQDYAQFPFPAWDSCELFGNEHPVSLEFCSGNGDWIIEKAKSHPERNWVAIEIRFDRVRKIYAKRQILGLKNLLIVCGEGKTFSQWYLKDQLVSESYINFPDPWPKKRHAKHRLLSPSFVAELERILKEGGKAHFVSDDLRYMEESVALFENSFLFTPRFPHPYYSTDSFCYGVCSWFETLWREKGREIRYAFFDRKGGACP
ncbi:MAG: tRNA (guanine-N(7)-)-methyltransferase [Chlamydiae bacterium]|nr:tRNA (guanine-N(7)-)-methyltransferase [Chlamydiota bacterium]